MRFNFLVPLRIANTAFIIAVVLHGIAAMQEGRPLIRWGAATKVGASIVILAFISLYTAPFQTSHSLNSLETIWKPVVLMIMLEAMVTSVQRAWAVMATVSIATLWWMKAGFRLATAGESFRGERLMGPAVGLMDDPNAFAYMVVIIVPLYMFMAKYTTNKWVGRGYLLMALLSVYIVIETGSRSGFVAMLVMGLLLIIHYWKRRKKSIIFVSVAVALIFPFTTESNRQRVLSLADSFQTFVYGEPEDPNRALTQDEQSSLERRLKNRDTWSLIKAYPALGAGVSPNQALHAREYPYARGIVHCEILRAGYQMGMGGMLLYASMLATIIYFGWKVYKAHSTWPEMREMAWTLFAAGVTVSVAGFFGSSPWNPMTMTFCALASSLSVMQKQQ
ncbi:MAG: O-antigen ligase family protein [Kiritimatiellae bacterium]|nr:O-antigen ligase family protein [Kiritimatiellia bacterium]